MMAGRSIIQGNRINPLSHHRYFLSSLHLEFDWFMSLVHWFILYGLVAALRNSFVLSWFGSDITSLFLVPFRTEYLLRFHLLTRIGTDILSQGNLPCFLQPSFGITWIILYLARDGLSYAYNILYYYILIFGSLLMTCSHLIIVDCLGYY